jgi:hypothetical protein
MANEAENRFSLHLIPLIYVVAYRIFALRYQYYLLSIDKTKRNPEIKFRIPFCLQI